MGEFDRDEVLDRMNKLKWLCSEDVAKLNNLVKIGENLTSLTDTKIKLDQLYELVIEQLQNCKPDLAQMIKDAGFRYPRIAWDWGYEEYTNIREQINLLMGAGYPAKDIYVFMLYNWDIPFEKMETKRRACWEWQVQIADCRYRPLNQLFDNYNPQKTGQTAEDYYLHEQAGWTDVLIKQFRRNVREQNICVRHSFPFYSRTFEHKKFNKEIIRKVKEQTSVECKTGLLASISADFWLPGETRYPTSS